mmetsp:Transcript_81323/g.226430  ORF Transcript_81323/g.226430 Transcript_81323/m.226430 type:complete len:141 (-) Transcript_81323:18-440(-)
MSSSANQDAWAAILAQSTGEYCYVPTVVLENLRRLSEERQREIRMLERLLAEAPDADAQDAELASRINELQASRVIAENEVELRRQDAVALEGEAAKLRATRDELLNKIGNAQSKVKKLERWLGGSTTKSQRVTAAECDF